MLEEKMFCGNVPVELSEQVMKILGKDLNNFSEIARIKSFNVAI